MYHNFFASKEEWNWNWKAQQLTFKMGKYKLYSTTSRTFSLKGL